MRLYVTSPAKGPGCSVASVLAHNSQFSKEMSIFTHGGNKGLALTWMHPYSPWLVVSRTDAGKIKLQ